MSGLLSSNIEKFYNKVDTIHAKRIKQFYQDKKFDEVIDVGSHKGEFINLVIDDQTPVYSFEPQTSVREILKRNTANKNIQQYYNFALSDFDGEIELYLNNLTSTSSTKVSDTSSPWIKLKKTLLGGELISGKEVVPVTTLDNVLFETLNPNSEILIKIDVEGAEAEVLRGAEKILRERNVSYIQLESANYDIYSNDKSVSPTDLLKDYGYKIEKKFLFPLLNFTDIIYSKQVN